MKKTVVLSLFLLPLLHAQEKSAAPFAVMAPAGEYMIADPKEEIALARTAAPPSISAKATVLVLGAHGYETAVKGENDFVCFVERAWDAGFDDPEFWNPKTRGPDCLNAPAARSVLPQYMKRAEWALAGLNKAQIMAKVREAVADHAFVEPEAGSLSFMLSKQGYLNGANGPWLPHLMYFVPHGQAAMWGAGLEGSPVIGKDGGPLEPTVLVVPVRRWSDGSAAQPAGEHQHS